jgi:hypothetical protein
MTSEIYIWESLEDKSLKKRLFVFIRKKKKSFVQHVHADLNRLLEGITSALIYKAIASKTLTEKN